MVDSAFNCRYMFRGCKFESQLVDIDHEIISTVILSLPLVQEGQLSVIGISMCISLTQTAIACKHQYTAIRIPLSDSESELI